MAELDLKTPFDEDSHTLDDGALQRFFRMRKWMFASASALLLLDMKWWDFGATTKALALEHMPVEALHFALSGAGTYLLVQALIVAVQIYSTYGYSLEVRRDLVKVAGEKFARQFSDELKAERLEISENIVRGVYPADQLPLIEGRLENIDEQFLSLQVARGKLYYRGNRNRRLTMLAEIALDLMRIVPMPLFLAYTIVAHGYWPPMQFA